MIPEAAVEAAAQALRDAFDWGVADFDKQARAALEAAAPHMLAGAAVATVEELDALPRFSVIRSDEGAVFERQTMWHEAGSRDLMYSPDITLPATVLQFGWGEE